MSFRSLLTASEPQLGTMVAEFATPGIGHILKAADLDFGFLDMEHSGFGMGDLKAMLSYFQAADLPVILRPPSKSSHHLSRALDAGADALLLPMVNSAAEATDLVAAIKYPPEGVRGVALGFAHDRYTGGDAKAKLTAANQKTVLIPLIETRAGLDAVEAIAKVNGVDGLWIGHFDLSASMGIPGAFDDPRFLAAVDRIAAAAKAADIPLCQLVGSADDGCQMIAKGFHMICYGIDSGLLRDALAAGISQIRAGST